jgi:hypothetical protein
LGVDGFALDFSASVIVEPLTTWWRTADVLLADDASPPYAAVIEFEPVARVAVEKVPTPLASVIDPIVVAPFLRVTVPVGVTPVDEAVTAKVTDCS